MRGVLSIGRRRGQLVVRLYGEAARDDGDVAARQTDDPIHYRFAEPKDGPKLSRVQSGNEVDGSPRE